MPVSDTKASRRINSLDGRSESKELIEYWTGNVSKHRQARQYIRGTYGVYSSLDASEDNRTCQISQPVKPDRPYVVELMAF